MRSGLIGVVMGIVAFLVDWGIEVRPLFRFNEMAG